MLHDYYSHPNVVWRMSDNSHAIVVGWCLSPSYADSVALARPHGPVFLDEWLLRHMIQPSSSQRAHHQLGATALDKHAAPAAAVGQHTQ